MNTTTVNARSSISTKNSINTSTTSISTSTHSPEANPACISVDCHYSSTTTTTTSQGDETSSGSSPFWKFLLAGLAGAGSVVVGLFLWKSCRTRKKTGQPIISRPLHLQRLDRGELPFADRPSLYPSNVASGSNSSDSDSSDEQGGTNQGSPPSYEKALHM